MKVKVTPISDPRYEEIGIRTEFIKLDAFLKLANAAESGGEAKIMIQNGEVLLNGAVCLTRGKKLLPGDRVRVRGRRLMVVRDAP